MFLQIVQPEIEKKITIHDQDMKKAIKFMTLSSSIYYQYVVDLDKYQIRKPENIAQLEHEYKQLIDKPIVQKALDRVFNRFLNNVFGPYSNRVDCEAFTETLVAFSWCWFSVIDLNTIFMEELQKLMSEEEFEEPAGFKIGRETRKM